MFEVIDKYFKNDRARGYHTPDLINTGQYITYEVNGDKVIIYLCDEESSIAFKVCSTPESLEATIKFIID